MVSLLYAVFENLIIPLIWVDVGRAYKVLLSGSNL